MPKLGGGRGKGVAWFADLLPLLPGGGKRLCCCFVLNNRCWLELRVNLCHSPCVNSHFRHLRRSHRSFSPCPARNFSKITLLDFRCQQCATSSIVKCQVAKKAALFPGAFSFKSLETPISPCGGGGAALARHTSNKTNTTQNGAHRKEEGKEEEEEEGSRTGESRACLRQQMTARCTTM